MRNGLMPKLGLKKALIHLYLMNLLTTEIELT